MPPQALLWPDDVQIPSRKDGTLARLGGHQLYFISSNLTMDMPGLVETHGDTITRHIMENAGEEPVELLTTNIHEIIRRRPFTVAQKIERLLRALARRTDFQVGSVTLVHDRQATELYPLLRETGISAQRQLSALFDHLALRGFASYQETTTSATASITVDGLLEVERIGAPSSESQSAFVAMWFDPEMNAAYQAIERAIEANDYLPDRVDKRDYNHKVDDEIIARIREARFVVADFSSGADGARGGVYFEAGFGLALDKPVIFTVRKADIGRLHFDTRQFNHIVWETEAELEELLRNRIGRTVGKFRQST